MKAIDDFFARQDEPARATLLALRGIILQQDKHISSAWKYGMPFFCYKGKMFCYLWLHKKHGLPYIGMVEGKRFNESFLLQESRSRMKIMLIDPRADLPLKEIKHILQKAIAFYTSGEIPIK